MKRGLIFLLFFQTITASQPERLKNKTKRSRLFSQDSNISSSPDLRFERQNDYRYLPSEQTSALLPDNINDQDNQAIWDFDQIQDEQQLQTYLKNENNCLREENNELQDKYNNLSKKIMQNKKSVDKQLQKLDTKQEALVSGILKENNHLQKSFYYSAALNVTLISIWLGYIFYPYLNEDNNSH